MGTVPDYGEVVSLYIRLISEDSPTAAHAIEQIRITCDARAALRATLVMTLVKIEAQRHQPIPDVSVYAYMLVDYPQALPLLALAIECWSKDRRLRAEGLALKPVSDLTDADALASVSIPDLPPDLEE